MKEPLEFLIVKVDEVRGNIVISRRAVLEKIKNIGKEEIIKKYKIGDVVDGVVKGITDYGIFFDLDGKIDCMCHINHASWSRINHPSELFSLNQQQKLKIIDIDIPNKKISVSCKELVPDPFETKINSYSEGQIVENCEIIRVLDYGAFVKLEETLEGLVHSSHISHHTKKKGVLPKNIVSVAQRVTVKILSIEKNKRRISLSIKDCKPNPWKKFKEEYPINSNCTVVVNSHSDFAIFADIKDHELSCMCHRNDLDWDPEKQDPGLFKKGDKISAKVLEVNEEKEQVRIGLKQNLLDPFLECFKDKKEKDIITAIVLKTLGNGLEVSPDGYPHIKIVIKKNQLAADKGDQRFGRFNQGDKVDTMLQDLDLKKRKAILSMKLLEEEQNKLAIKRFGSLDSGKALPFADLSKALEKKNETKEK
jgi:small subunit ribosomal protein S1